MAVAAGDATVLVVDAEFCTLIAADLATAIDRLLLGVCMHACATRAAQLYVPSSVGVWHDVMRLWPLAHWLQLHIASEAIIIPLLRTSLHGCHSAVKSIKYAFTEHVEAGDTHLANILGEKIRKLRKEKGLTLDKLADLTGSSKSYIWELENKNPPRPSADKLAKIAEQLETTLEFLLDEGEVLSQEDAADARFYRQYRKMDSATKAKVRQIMRLWDEDT